MRAMADDTEDDMDDDKVHTESAPDADGGGEDDGKLDPGDVMVAKMAQLEDTIAALTQQNTDLKAQNYDLLMSIPGSPIDPEPPIPDTDNYEYSDLFVEE